MRRLAVGDIHGNLDALRSGLDEANYDPVEDQLYFVGDYIDRQKRSEEVIDLILSLPNKICLRGNHDQFMIDYLNQKDPDKKIDHIWWDQGGDATLDSYGIKSRHAATGLITISGKIPDDHKHFFRSLEPYYITEDGYGLVHGGFDLHMKDMSTGYVIWDRSMWRTAKEHEPKGQATYPCFQQFEKIFIGHTNLLTFPGQRGCLPQKRLNVWNIDTGAGFTGPLTIMDMDTEKYWQSN